MAGSDAPAAPAPTASSKGVWARAVPALIFLAAGAIVWIITANWDGWTSEKLHQATDDAFVRADVTPLSTKVAGTVAEVAVSDYQTVKAGDLVVRLRDDDFQAQVAQALAALEGSKQAIVNNRKQQELQDSRILQAHQGVRGAEAEILAAEAGIEAGTSAIATARSGQAAAKADATQAQLERRRQESLVAVEAATRQRLEQIVATEERAGAAVAARDADLSTSNSQLASRKADLLRAQARLESSKAEVEVQIRQRAVLDAQALLLGADIRAKEAALAVARTNLDYTRIVAPESGVVGERKVRPGQFVSPGTQVLSLVESNLWVQANYRETQMRRMRPGDSAEIRVDALPGVVLRGHLDQIAPASGSQFALLPPDNATGNFTKIVQRVPVKIVFDQGQPEIGRLRPGLSVVASVNVRSSKEN